MHVTMGLTPVTFRVPGEVSQRFGLSWHQFVMGDTVESSIRSGNDLSVTKDETRDVCRGKISKSISHFTPSHNMVTIHHQDTVNRRDNSHPHLTDSPFLSGRPRMRQFEQFLSWYRIVFTLQHDQQHRSHQLGTRCQTSQPRADDRWARLTLLLWSQREESGASESSLARWQARSNLQRARTHLCATGGRKSICQIGKLHETSAKTLDGEARLLEGGEGSTRESFGEGGNGQKDGGTKEQSFPICSKTASATSPSSHSRTDERSVEE